MNCRGVRVHGAGGGRRELALPPLRQGHQAQVPHEGSHREPALCGLALPSMHSLRQALQHQEQPGKAHFNLPQRIRNKLPLMILGSQQSYDVPPYSQKAFFSENSSRNLKNKLNCSHSISLGIELNLPNLVNISIFIQSAKLGGCLEKCCYNLSNKFWHDFYSNLLYKIGNDFLDIPYNNDHIRTLPKLLRRYVWKSYTELSRIVLYIFFSIGPVFMIILILTRKLREAITRENWA